MKKITAIFLSLAALFCFALGFAGCEETARQEEKDKIEVNGKFYTLSHAYDNGYIDENDVKNIACLYYGDGEENPYAGLCEWPAGKLGEDTEKEIKQAYLEQIENKADGSIDKIKIGVYYGTFNKNIAVSIASEYFMCDLICKDEYIGGVIFKGFNDGSIRVYYCGEEDKQPVEISGQLYTVNSAYSQGLLTTDDLKILSCAHYENLVNNYPSADFGENLYAGLYERPKDLLSLNTRKEIKQAFLEQFVGYPYTSVYDAEIIDYYGTFNGNIAVSIEYQGREWPSKYYEKTEIGGILFKTYSEASILIYHNN